MRRAQINIKMELFGDQAINGHAEKIVVYADSNNAFETLCIGFQEVLNALQEQGHELPGFGRREHRCSTREPQYEVHSFWDGVDPKEPDQLKDRKGPV